MYQRFEEEGISVSMNYTNIDDQQLDELVYRVKLAHPNDAWRAFDGRLVKAYSLHMQDYEHLFIEWILLILH